MMRRKMKRGRDRKVFSRTARNTQSANLRANPMRGGFRM